MGKKKGGNTGTPVVEYHLSTHLGYCIGPVDQLLEISFKEKKVGTNVHRTSLDRIAIDERDLFGGPKKEGGVHGALWFLPGQVDQVLPQELAGRLGGTSDTVPGFRRICSLFLHGNGWNNQPGFLVSSNMPTVTYPWARLTKGARLLDSPWGQPPSPNGRYNVNAAHAIYEALVNDDWGMNGSPFVIDTESFLKAAETLYNENFGITIYWTQQTNIESMVQGILDTINGMFFFNPSTGKATLRLLRNDYDIDNLETIGPNVARMVSFRRKLWGETVNELVVSWTNPETEDTESLTYQNLANIAMQGEVVSEERQYEYVRDADLASRLGARDMIPASMPLATAVIEVTRSAWKRLPGDVVNFVWPKYEIENLVMRVMEIDYGSPTDSKMRVTLVEDVFGLSYARYADPPPTEWEEPGTYPEPVEPKIISTPKPIIDRFYTFSDDMYPAITPSILASPPAYDVNTFALSVEGMTIAGDIGWLDLGDRSTIGMGKLSIPLGQEAISILRLGPVAGGISPTPGSLGLLGEGDDAHTELVLFIEDLTVQHTDLPPLTTVWKVVRGVWDTVPAVWDTTTNVRIMTQSFNAIDFGERLAFDTLRYKLQPHAGKGTLPFDLAPVNEVVLVDRPYLPFRPANILVAGVPFGLSDWSNDEGLRRTHADISWSNRNRDTEDTVTRHWDDAEMTPEDGQTTEIIVYNMAMEEIDRIVGLTGTSYSLPLDLFQPGDDGGFVKLVSRRDGYESLQGLTIEVRFQPRGFGYDYGFGYGGWIGWEE